MARSLRIGFPSAVYHVTSRGDRREPIFEDDQDRHAFLTVLEKDKGDAKDIPRLQRHAQARPIDYYLKRNKDRDTGIHEAVTNGQHSMTDVGRALGLTVSRVSRIVKAANACMAIGKA
jgi:DNA-directed RNA polymerase specialized sigma subunit